ncbi:unnamed protein product, partial [marine sediment metagenome]
EEKIFGIKDVNKQKMSDMDKIRDVIASCPNIMIFKDEAHHIHNKEKSWKKILLNLDKDLKSEYGEGIWMELDFTATPKDDNGKLWPWIIVDFALKEAILSNIVKHPIIAEVKNAVEGKGTAKDKYRKWIDAGINRWREYKKKLKKVGKTPILFILCENTKEADEIYRYVNSKSGLTNRVLNIHTKVGEASEAYGGDIEKKKNKSEKLDDLRKAARDVDKEGKYCAIVSVMMLNEGWDVRNVNIIVGLRAFSSKREVLPEQTIGRGLRKMFMNAPASEYINTLEIIGPPGLTGILEKTLLKEENIRLRKRDIREKIDPIIIEVDEYRANMNIAIPKLSPRITRKTIDISTIKKDDIKKGRFKLEESNKKIKYIGRDIITGKIIVEREWTLPVPKNIDGIIQYYTAEILRKSRLPKSNFKKLYPIVKSYIEAELFQHPVKLSDKRLLQFMCTPEVGEHMIEAFAGKITHKTLVQKDPKLEDTYNCMAISPFVW